MMARERALEELRKLPASAIRKDDKVNCGVCGRRLKKPHIRLDQLCSGGGAEHCFLGTQDYAFALKLPFYDSVRAWIGGNRFAVVPERIAKNRVAADMWVMAGKPWLCEWAKGQLETQNSVHNAIVAEHCKCSFCKEGPLLRHDLGVMPSYSNTEMLPLLKQRPSGSWETIQEAYRRLRLEWRRAVISNVILKIAKELK